jgi:hypothetical protein
LCTALINVAENSGLLISYYLYGDDLGGDMGTMENAMMIKGNCWGLLEIVGVCAVGGGW